MVKTFIKMT